MKTYKGDFYFPSRDAAREYAVSNAWPIDRIIEFGRGFAIQLCIAGPYVGPDLIERRKKGMKETNKRWMAVCAYRTANGPVLVEHFIEELDEIQMIVERGPDWNSIINITIVLNRHSAASTLTVEDAAKL